MSEFLSLWIVNLGYMALLGLTMCAMLGFVGGTMLVYDRLGLDPFLWTFPTLLVVSLLILSILVTFKQLA